MLLKEKPPIQEKSAIIEKVESSELSKTEQIKTLGDRLRQDWSRIKARYAADKIYELNRSSDYLKHITKKELEKHGIPKENLDAMASYEVSKDKRSLRINNIDASATVFVGAMEEAGETAMWAASDAYEYGGQKLQELKKSTIEKSVTPAVIKGMEIASNAIKTKDSAIEKGKEVVITSAEAIKNLSSLAGQKAQSGWNRLSRFFGKKVDQAKNLKADIELSYDNNKAKRIEAKIADLAEKKQKLNDKYQ